MILSNRYPRVFTSQHTRGCKSGCIFKNRGMRARFTSEKAFLELLHVRRTNVVGEEIRVDVIAVKANLGGVVFP